MEERNLTVFLNVGKGKKRQAGYLMKKNSESCHVVLSVLGFQEAGRSRAPKVSGNVHMSFEREMQIWGLAKSFFMKLCQERSHWSLLLLAVGLKA